MRPTGRQRSGRREQEGRGRLGQRPHGGLARGWSDSERPVSAPPSPAKSRSVTAPTSPDGCRRRPPAGCRTRPSGTRSPHPSWARPAGPGEPGMLSPTSTLAPALMPASALALAPIPVSPQSPNLLTYICPWENAELPVKKQNVAQEGPSGQSKATRLMSQLGPVSEWPSVAVEKRGPGENGMDTEDGHLQGETEEDVRTGPRSSLNPTASRPCPAGFHAQPGPGYQSSDPSRSTHREKESGKGVLRRRRRAELLERVWGHASDLPAGLRGE